MNKHTGTALDSFDLIDDVIDGLHLTESKSIADYKKYIASQSMALKHVVDAANKTAAAASDVSGLEDLMLAIYQSMGAAQFLVNESADIMKDALALAKKGKKPDLRVQQRVQFLRRDLKKLAQAQ